MFIEKIINSLGKFISLMIPVMTILMMMIIVARYFFGIGLTGLQEFVMYLHAFIFLGCAGYVHFKDEQLLCSEPGGKYLENPISGDLLSRPVFYLCYNLHHIRDS